MTEAINGPEEFSDTEHHQKPNSRKFTTERIVWDENGTTGANNKDKRPLEFSTAPKKLISVDRKKNVPFLVKVFWQESSHFPLYLYDTGKFPSNQVQIYTWKDATIQEIAALIQEVCPSARKNNVRLEMRQIYYHFTSGKHRLRELGSFVPHTKIFYPFRSGGRFSEVSGEQPFAERFSVGDFLDVCIRLPRENFHSHSNTIISPPENFGAPRDAEMVESCKDVTEVCRNDDNNQQEQDSKPNNSNNENNVQ